MDSVISEPKLTDENIVFSDYVSAEEGAIIIGMENLELKRKQMKPVTID